MCTPYLRDGSAWRSSILDIVLGAYCNVFRSDSATHSPRPRTISTANAIVSRRKWAARAARRARKRPLFVSLCRRAHICNQTAHPPEMAERAAKAKGAKGRTYCPPCCVLTHLGALSVAGRGTASQEAAAPGFAVDEGGPGHACSVGRPANNGGVSVGGRTGGGGARAGAPAAVANPVPQPRMHPQILLPQRRSFLHRCK